MMNQFSYHFSIYFFSPKNFINKKFLIKEEEMPFKNYAEDEPDEDKFNAMKLKSYRRHTLFKCVGFSLLSIVILCVIIYFIARSLRSEPPDKIDRTERGLTLRLDCLPWRKSGHRTTHTRLRDECLKLPECIYDLVESEKYEIPACYYNTSMFKMTLTSEDESTFGKSYTIEASKRNQIRMIKIDFEFLEDYVMRFKVRSISKKSILRINFFFFF